MKSNNTCPLVVLHEAAAAVSLPGHPEAGEVLHVALDVVPEQGELEGGRNLMLYLFTLDTGLLSSSWPPMMMKESVSSSEMAQAELKIAYNAQKGLRRALLKSAVSPVNLSANGAKVAGKVPAKDF